MEIYRCRAGDANRKIGGGNKAVVESEIWEGREIGGE